MVTKKLTKNQNKETYANLLDDKLLSILLKDWTSNKNIIWATNIYSQYGRDFGFGNQITNKVVSNHKFEDIIKPRANKSNQEKEIRIRTNGEVFTPAWVCNNQINAIDNHWFGNHLIFNVPKKKNWKTNKSKIIFSDEKTWKDYVLNKRLEITCGEAPYLVSRYDSFSGENIDIKDRIGILDRKLRVISENEDEEPQWYQWVVKAYQNTYGYEWQGDNLLIARENLFFTFIDYYLDKFKVYPNKQKMEEICKIISWNIWQMDGLKFVIPNSCKPTIIEELTLFGSEERTEICAGCENENNSNHLGIYCKIKKWETNDIFNFLWDEKNMKFDFVIGNPPYQETLGKTQTQSMSSSTWVYQYFQFEADKIGDCSCLIFPFGSWFNSPDAWGGR